MLLGDLFQRNQGDERIPANIYVHAPRRFQRSEEQPQRRNTPILVAPMKVELFDTCRISGSWDDLARGDQPFDLNFFFKQGDDGL
jgi:hypothetical protein